MLRNLAVLDGSVFLLAMRISNSICARSGGHAGNSNGEAVRRFETAGRSVRTARRRVTPCKDGGARSYSSAFAGTDESAPRRKSQQVRSRMGPGAESTARDRSRILLPIHWRVALAFAALVELAGVFKHVW